jgi:hypothetical protein
MQREIGTILVSQKGGRKDRSVLSAGELEALLESLLAPVAQARSDLLVRNAQHQSEAAEVSELDRPDATVIIGLTTTGRATIEALWINRTQIAVSSHEYSPPAAVPLVPVISPSSFPMADGSIALMGRYFVRPIAPAVETESRQCSSDKSAKAVPYCWW